jgi:DNA repair exonuclease SbcCD ATPase subunit
MELKITPQVRREIEKIIDDRIVEKHVRREDFTELKEIVKELAEEQKKLAEEQKKLAEELRGLAEELRGLAEEQRELAKQQRELVVAQKRTEISIQRLTAAMEETRHALGMLGRSVSYGFENEVYRALPAFLERNYGIEMKERFIRKTVRGREINILGKGIKDGEEVVIVGEVKLRLEYIKKREGEMDEVDELEEKVNVVREEYKTDKIMKLLVAHIASEEFVKKAKERGVVVIQSFEL